MIMLSDLLPALRDATPIPQFMGWSAAFSIPVLANARLGTSTTVSMINLVNGRTSCKDLVPESITSNDAKPVDYIFHKALEAPA